MSGRVGVALRPKNYIAINNLKSHPAVDHLGVAGAFIMRVRVAEAISCRDGYSTIVFALSACLVSAAPTLAQSVNTAPLIGSPVIFSDQQYGSGGSNGKSASGSDLCIDSPTDGGSGGTGPTISLTEAASGQSGSTLALISSAGGKGGSGGSGSSCGYAGRGGGGGGLGSGLNYTSR